MIHFHVDADELRLYADEYGVQEARAAPSVYEEALPRFLDIFEAEGVRGTFFVVGEDLTSAAARAFCADAVSRGHEVANHTLSHRPDLHRLRGTELEREIVEAHVRIGDACGVAPVGFRTPGYHLGRPVVDRLAANGYLYDSSLLPSFVPRLMKLYVEVASRRRTEKAFGIPGATFAPRRIVRIDTADGPVLELPIAVLPLVRLPVHSTFGFRFGPAFRALAVASLRRSLDGVYLFHAVDAYSHAVDERLASRLVPLRLSGARRLELVRETVRALAGRGDATTTRRRLEQVDASAVPRSRLFG